MNALWSGLVTQFQFLIGFFLLAFFKDNVIAIRWILSVFADNIQSPYLHVLSIQMRVVTDDW